MADEKPGEKPGGGASAKDGGEGGSEGGTPEPPKDWQTEAEKWKALSRKNEEEAKSLRAKAAKLDELESAGRSETEKLTAEATAAEARAATAEAQLLRLEVAAEKGLTPTQARRLLGSTREELVADADELIKTFGKPEEKPSGGPGPRRRERLRGGTDPTDEPEERDPRKLAAKVPRR